MTQVGLEFAWDGGGYTATIDGTETADGYVWPQGAGKYWMLIKGASVFAGATTLPAAVTITANVSMQNPSDTSESDTAVLTASTTIYAPPTLTITSPAEGATVNALPITLTWDVTDATGITGQYINLWKVVDDVGWELDDYFPDVAARTYTISSSVIENDAQYLVNFRANNGVGLSSTAHVRFSTHWAPPPTPTATVTSDTEAMTATITPTAGAGTPATDHFIVARVNADGTRWAIADNVESGESVTDPLPPLGVEYSYAVTAVTEAGTTSVATVAHVVETRAWALNFGASAGEVMTLVGNPKASYSLDQGGAAYHFADGGSGDGLPVWYGTTDRDESGTLSFDTMLWHDSDRLRELCRQYPVAWLRDPFGHRWRAHVQPKISHGIGDTWQVSINWDAVRFEEAW